MKRLNANGQPRVGFGYDIHPFAGGRKLVLGGVRIPFDQGLLGHSDADVLLHAICDALLGAAALGDIGKHFPNSDLRYKNISSLRLLARVNALIRREGFHVSNVDATLVLERPKILSYVPLMQKKISQSLGIDPGLISIKATTNEGLGHLGRGEGCAAYAIVMLL